MTDWFIQMYESAPTTLQNIYLSIRDYIMSLGDDVTENQLKFYVAFKKVRNIACVEIYMSKILVHLALKPTKMLFIDGFTKDMSNIGHYGTGNVQVTIRTMEDFEKAKPLFDKAYNEG